MLKVGFRKGKFLLFRQKGRTKQLLYRTTSEHLTDQVREIIRWAYENINDLPTLEELIIYLCGWMYHFGHNLELPLTWGSLKSEHFREG